VLELDQEYEIPVLAFRVASYYWHLACPGHAIFGPLPCSNLLS
jgi:hypothetical protein